MSSPLPQTIHVSNHSCVRAKLSQLRSHTTSSKDTQTLVHEIATIVGADALGHGLQTVQTGTVSSPTNISPTTADTLPDFLSLTCMSVVSVGPLSLRLRVHYRRHCTCSNMPRTHPAIRSKHAGCVASTPALRGISPPSRHVQREEHATAC